MPTIYKANTDRISVADAKRLILEGLPSEKSGEVYAQVDANGDIDWEGPLELVEVEGVQTYELFMHRDFLAICHSVSVQPRMKYNPVLTDYVGGETQDLMYTIGHDEFVRLAGLYDLTVVIGTAPEPQATAPSPAPMLAAAAPDAAPLPQWKMRVQAKAAEHWKTLRAAGANPTVSSILEWMARWCQDNNVFTDSGINPSAGYLRTHVLGGKHWTPPT